MAENGDTQFFKYTKNDFFITKAQREFYENHGYLIIRKLVDDELLEECKQRFIDICNDKIEKKPLLVMKDISLQSTDLKGEFVINKIQDFSYDDVLFKYISYKPMVDIVSSIIGPNITAMHNMLINKPPNADPDISRHPLHQDVLYLPIRPANSAVASWTAMEHIDEKNGCLFVIPGSHKAGPLRHERPLNMKNKSYFEIFGFEDVPKVNIIMEKGDTVFFHPVLMHGSGPNMTKGFRKAISCHYVDSNCFIVNIQGTILENVCTDVQRRYTNMIGSKANFEDIVQLKSRLIRGLPGNFQKVESHL